MLTYSSIDVAFCRTKCNRLAVIYEDYYFHHNRRYKDGHYWCCAHRSCKVRLISNGQLAFSRRNNRLEHQHPPNAPNLIDKEFRSQLLQQLARQPNSSVRHVYDHIYQSAIDRGVPDKLIPSFWSVRSTMYRLKPNRVDDDPINNNFSSSNSSIMEIRSSMQQQNSLEYPSRSVEGGDSPEPNAESVEVEESLEFFTAPQEEPLSLVKPKIQLPESSPSPSSPPPLPPPQSPLPSSLSLVPLPPKLEFNQSTETVEEASPGPSGHYTFGYDYSMASIQQQPIVTPFARIPIFHPDSRMALPNFTPEFLHHSWDLYTASLQRLESLRMLQLLPSYTSTL